MPQISELFKQLQTDHINLRQVVEILCETFYDYAHHKGRWNLDLMIEAIGYIQEYPERFHHPLEEAAFEYLLNNHMGDTHIIERLQHQHTLLEEQTAMIKNLFYALEDELYELGPEAEQNFDNYIAMQKHHIDVENRYVFPVMAKISDDAWWNIASSMAIHRDPLFNSSSEEKQQFATLLAHIKSHGSNRPGEALQTG